MPIGILVSLLVCTVLYILFAHVMTGVAHYTEFEGHVGIAPVAVAIENMGTADASGIITPAYPWLNKAIILAILFEIFLKNKRKDKNTGTQQFVIHGSGKHTGRICTGTGGRRNDKYRYSACIYISLCRNTCSAENDA